MKIWREIRRKLVQLDQIDRLMRATQNLERSEQKIREALGRIECRQLSAVDDPMLSRNEFRVFSQWGEDGIIQLLLRQIGPVPEIFVEFGVEDYTEANTRFLLVNNNWSGLVIDGSEDNVARIKKQAISWQHSLTAVRAFITRENINRILAENGIGNEVGLLSIDIDGNDYWVWEAITLNAAIVVIEYNHRFGAGRAVTVPYREDFFRTTAHHSNVYYGASLRALCLLGKRKGYAFVGCNSAGNNAFFVRRDLLPARMREVPVEEGFRSARFREARGKDGRLLFLSPAEEAKILESLPLIEIE